MTAADVMKAMVQAFVTGDLSEIEAVVHPDYVDHQGLREVPITGQEGFRQVVTAARATYAELDVTIEDLLVDGPRVAARLRWKGKRIEDGATLTRDTIAILRVADNRAIEHWGVRLWMQPE